ncbi:DoxX family protein [Alcaligenes endophyticus]|uniref:DoxX family protein n=1 Tax=Alcaligenes endophyticus TaxID=1929088 RepID=A0ABT8EMX0_9BURK|nr:DoxX family protein [Alcaligenes endophyticus]MCX5591471.1 DoxX family protein [Alcaligenes endophyticus]MDN4122648.1 DoxX family protein [Alcaligenes endophyticus]
MLNQEDLGRLLLRLTVGILLLLHGIAKIRFGISGIEKMVVAQGLPSMLAWGVYVGEVVAPLLLILGTYARLGGLLAAVNMVAALILAHWNQFGSFSAQGTWALELPMLFLVGAISCALLGPGRYSIGAAGRWN